MIVETNAQHRPTVIGRQWLAAEPDTRPAAPAHTDLGREVSAHQASMTMYDTVCHTHIHNAVVTCELKLLQNYFTAFVDVRLK